MIITFANFKGGVGKTTATSLFAFILSEMKGKKVLVVDTDPQASLTEDLERTFKVNIDYDKNIFNSIFVNSDISDDIQSLSNNLDILAGSWDLVNFKDNAVKNFEPEYHSILLKVLLNGIEEDYDFILIDTAPTTDITMDNAVFASDWIIIPTKTERPAFSSTEKYYNYLLNLYRNKDTNFELLGILPYLVGDSATDKRLLKNYEEFFEGYLFTNSIRQSDRVKTWFDFGITTNEAHDKNTISMYGKVVEEALNKIKGI